MTLSNDILSIEISEKGAELSSIEKNGRQYLWSADANFWNRHAPILFPIVGRLRDDKCRFSELECYLKQHGFARDSRFAPTGKSGELKLAEKPAPEVYPFDFDLSVHYELDGNQIKAVWTVVNQGDETMWFQIGAHPGFMLPQYDANDAVHGYFRLYDSKGKIAHPSLFSDLDDGLRKPLSSPTPLPDDEIPITNEIFAKGALLIEESQVASAELLDKNKQPILRVDCPQAEALGLWAPFKKGCPFVCIEPWCGIADSVGFTGDFSKRTYTHCLKSREEFKFEYHIII